MSTSDVAGDVGGEYSGGKGNNPSVGMIRS